MSFIILISLIIYIVAMVAIYHNLYNFDKNKRIQFILLGCAIVCVITIAIVFISSSNIKIENREYKSYKEYINITKITSILLFSPINAMISLPYMANLFNKYRQQSIREEELKRKIFIIVIAFILIGILEIGYIKNFEIDMIRRAIGA